MRDPLSKAHNYPRRRQARHWSESPEQVEPVDTQPHKDIFFAHHSFLPTYLPTCLPACLPTYLPTYLPTMPCPAPTPNTPLPGTHASIAAVAPCTTIHLTSHSLRPCPIALLAMSISTPTLTHCPASCLLAGWLASPRLLLLLSSSITY
jgi:hypothetical protein